MASSTEISDKHYRTELCRARTALREIEKALQDRDYHAARHYMGWPDVTDISHTRIQLEDVANRLLKRGLYAPAIPIRKAGEN